MRFVKRQELMQLPEGAIYQTYDSGILGPLMVKGETLVSEGQNIDWFEGPIGASTGSYYRKAYLSRPESREGRFDEQASYLAYDADDVGHMIQQMQGVKNLPQAVIDLPEDE